jgi:shikimate kinase
MHNKLKRTPGLFLTGFMGAGKSTVGQVLAEKLGWDFADLDTLIEAREGMPVSAIFSSHGEEAFRRMETAALQDLMYSIERGNPTVVALGGGTFPQPVNCELLSHAGLSVWLDCSLETALSRIPVDGARPLAADPANFRALYETRRSDYARADFRVDAERDPEAVAFDILNLPIWK